MNDVVSVNILKVVIIHVLINTKQLLGDKFCSIYFSSFHLIITRNDKWRHVCFFTSMSLFANQQSPLIIKICFITQATTKDTY